MAPPSDCSEKYCSGYSVLHFSPKPRFYTEDSQRFTELCPHNTFQKYNLSNNFRWTHTCIQDYCLSPEVKIWKCVTFQWVISVYSILSAAFLRPRASCAFVDPPEGGAQDMKNRKGGSYLHPLFQQLFPKLWDSSCFSHHMTSTVMVGFNEQISFRGRFTVRSCTFCVVKLALTGPAHLLPLFLWLGTIYEASALSFL